MYECSGACGRTRYEVELSIPGTGDAATLEAHVVALMKIGVRRVAFPDVHVDRPCMSPMAAAALVLKRSPLEPIVHLAARGRDEVSTGEVLERAQALGIRRVFAITGDDNAGSAFDSIALIEKVRAMPGDWTVGVAFNHNALDAALERERLARKLDAGADYVVTQPVFDEAQLDRVLAQLGDLPVPLVLGIMPLATPRLATWLHESVPGVVVPEAIRRDLAAQAPRRVMELARANVAGFHIMPMGHYELVGSLLS